MNITAQEKLSSLIEEISSAFNGVSRENGVSLHEAEVIDAYGSDAERAEARKQDTDCKWQDVLDEDIENHHSILSFLCPKGFRYYIPAYMIWTLKNYKTSGSSSVDSTIYAFDLSEDQDMQEWAMSRFSILTPEQSKAICHFLRFMVEHGDGHADDYVAQRALDNHWSRFC